MHLKTKLPVYIKTANKIWFFQDDMIEFKTKYHQAFVATVEYLAIIKEVTPAGYCYICPDDDRVRLNFPEECVSQSTQMAFKVMVCCLKQDKLFY